MSGGLDSKSCPTGQEPAATAGTTGGAPDFPPQYSARTYDQPQQQQQHYSAYPGNVIPPPPGPQVIIHQVNTQYGKQSVTTTCFNCHTSVSSTVKTSHKQDAWIWAAIMCICGCWCGCCCIPFCMESMNVYTHSCPKCNCVLGKSN